MRSTAGLSRRNAAAIWAIGLAVGLALGLAGWWRAAPLAALDRASFDGLLKATASGRPAEKTVVVDVDDVSLSALGQWPWPRYRLAALIQRIADERPAAIALDILLPEADRSSLASIRETFRRDFGVDVEWSGVPDGLLDNDGYLAQEIARADVVGSRYFYFDHVGRGDRPLEPALRLTGRTDLLALDEATGVLDNAAPIAARTRLGGFVNHRLDDDGVLRRLPLLIRHRGAIHANLSLVAVMRTLGVDQASIEAGRDGLRLAVGAHRVPIDPAGTALVRFDGPPRLYRAVSALDVVEGRVGADDFRGKVVFIGSSAVGLNDLHATSIAPRFPGLRVQAALAENILQDRFVAAPSWAPAAGLAACLLAGALMAALFSLTHRIGSIVAGSAALAAVAGSASYAAWAGAGLFVSAASTLLVVATLFVVFAAARFAIEHRRAEAWRRQLENARQVTIESMASVAETRDPETGAHIKRTQHYVRAIAQELRRTGHHRQTLTPEFIDLLFLSAPLHDVGKVGVPDQILMKPGRLTEQEMVLMKRHAEFGRQIIGSSSQHIEGDNFLTVAGEIAATHHEKWDGTGYPLGLAGAQIPLSGRIMAVADIYDALISRRCYKEPFPHRVAMDMMGELRGTTFDPDVLDAFVAIESEVLAIAARFKDDEIPPGSAPDDATARVIDRLKRLPTRGAAAEQRDAAPVDGPVGSGQDAAAPDGRGR